MDQEQFLAALDKLVEESLANNKTHESEAIETRDLAGSVLLQRIKPPHNIAENLVAKYFGSDEQTKKTAAEIANDAIRQIKEMRLLDKATR